MTKNDVIQELLRLQAEGHSMKTTDFDPKFYRAIKAHFGGYKSAKQTLGIKVVRKKHRYTSSPEREKANKDKVVWTEERIVSEVERFLEACKTRRDIYKERPALMSAINRTYGNFDSFETSTGIVVPQYEASPRYSDEELARFLRKMDREGKSSHSVRGAGDGEEKRLLDACKRRWGTYNKALEANGISVKRIKKEYSDEFLMERYLSERLAGVNVTQVSSYGTLKARFGSIEDLNEIVGFKEPTKYEPSLLDKKEVETRIDALLKSGIDRVTKEVIESYDADLLYSIEYHYGNLIKYFTERDMDYFDNPTIPFAWTRKSVEAHLRRWIDARVLVNYVAVAQGRRGILDAALRLYGGWSNVFTAIGESYDNYRVDTDMASYYGRHFEELLAEILSDLGVNYAREPEINGCHPDFVIGRDWVDAKLSEWTYRAPDCETLRKYEPNCDSLTIYYLRGYSDAARVTKVSEKTTLVSVFELIDRMPKEKRKAYVEKANNILEELSNKVA